MEITETILRDSSKSESVKLPKVLVKYKRSAFELQQRARFLYYLIFCLISCLALIITYTTYINIKSHIYNGEYFFKVLLPILGLIFIILIAYFSLIKGNYRLAGHLLLISVLSASWIVMLGNRNDILSRLDTIVFIMAGLTILPLVINSHKEVILLYILINIVFVFLFFIVLRDQFDVPNSSIIEYISDTTIALIFSGIVSYNIFRINKQTQEKAVTDFNEKLEAERALSESEKRYHALMENMNEVIIVTGYDHIVHYVNKRFTEKLGYTTYEIIGKTGDEILYSSEDKQLLEKVFTERIEHINPVFELSYKAKDGHRTDFLVSMAPYKNFVGKNTGLICALMDITEHKKAEKALNESQQQFQTLAQMSPVGIFRTSADGLTTYVNPKWTEISGLGFEEALGTGWIKAVHPDDVESVLNKWHKDSKSRDKSIAEYRFLRSDGSISWVLGESLPEIVDGELKGYIGTITNITEVVAAQKELEKYRNHLEQLVSERTLDLESANEKLKTTNQELNRQRKELQTAYNDLQDAQNKLIQAEKMASLGVLAAGIAHEINNPLNFINGGVLGLETLINEKMKESKSEAANYIGWIQTGVKRAAEIVTSLNLYSRQDDLPGSECNLHSIIDNCLVMLNNEIKYRIEVIKEYTKDQVQIFGNEGRFHQVFLNVLTNAIQSIADKGTIRISTRISNNRCVVSISDNGSGIKSELIPKLTDPFFTTKAPGKGTGLGLSITYNILKENNGTIEFESKQGEGTTVIITLPLFKK